MVGRSARTIQAVELLKAPLSTRLAMLVSAATGVAMEWLMSNDPEKRMLATDGSPLTIQYYEGVRAGAVIDGRDLARETQLEAQRRIASTFSFLAEHDQPRAMIAAWKLKTFLNGFEKEFAAKAE